MDIDSLTDAEKKVVFECLKAALEPSFFPDWEFHTIFGINRENFSQIVDAWPDVDFSDESVSLAVTNSLGNLIGYPHGMKERWGYFISVSPEKVSWILKKLSRKV